MMSETYVECLVKKKSNTGMVFLRMLTTIMAVAFILIGLIIWPALLIGVAMGVAAYFVYLNADLAKSKRKKVAKYEVERMEILAPIKSWHMDGFKNRTVKTVDYSSGVENQPDLRYVMYYEGNLKVILEPSMEMVKAIKNIAPRKVFMD